MPDFNKISPTAKIVAFFRTFSDIPYSAEIAKECGAKEYRDSLAKQMEEKFGEEGEVAMEQTIRRMAMVMEARFKAVSEIFRQREIKNILEIAAGFSPRGLIMTADPTVKYIETDLPDMVLDKKSFIEKTLSGQPRPNLEIIAADVLNHNELAKACENLSNNIGVCCEGLLRYYSHPDKKTIAKNIREILIEKGGIWVTPDVRTSEKFKERPAKDNEMRDYLTTRMVGYDINENLFKDENDFINFFQDCGFNVEIHPQSDFIKELSSAKKLGVEDSQAQERLSESKIAIMTLGI